MHNIYNEKKTIKKNNTNTAPYTNVKSKIIQFCQNNPNQVSKTVPTFPSHTNSNSFYVFT